MSDMESGVTVDFLILADAAQKQSDKLYMLGGGWSAVWAAEFPVNHQLAVAAGILVPWMETNHRHQFRIRLRGEDGSSFGELGGEFEQGRPPGLPPGSTQRVIITVNMTVRFEKPVEAAADLLIDGNVVKTVPFRVMQRPKR